VSEEGGGVKVRVGHTSMIFDIFYLPGVSKTARAKHKKPQNIFLTPRVVLKSGRVEVSYMEKDAELQRKEFDILAINGAEIVVVEVKTTLRPSDVSDFLKSLKDFKKYCPQYQSHTVYGAVAYLRSDAKSAVYSENKGLFVIRATGDSASIMNKKGFKPKAFSSRLQHNT